MIRAALVVLALATPLAAEDLPGKALCRKAWERLTALAEPVLTLSGDVTPSTMEGCLFTEVKADLPGPYVPDWHIGALHLREGAQALVDGTVPDRLALRVIDLRLVVQMGDARMDYVFAAQARANPIQADLALVWDREAREVRVEVLDIDFPGENRVTLTARATGVDLSSPGAAQMSLTSAALTEAALTVQSHGLFEAYLLNGMVTWLLSDDGDPAASMAALQAEATAAALALPEATFPGDSRASLVALIAEVPNPRGRLDLSFRAEPGFGATRFAGYAATGMPASIAAAGPLLHGVTIDIGWTHEENR